MGDTFSIQRVSYTEDIESIQAIRRQVFQMEQGVSPELEFDGHDEAATHFLAYQGAEAIGTARIRYLSSDIPENGPQDGPQDIPENGPKDKPKDGLKDNPKDKPQDGPKDGPKDRPKDSLKNAPGDEVKAIAKIERVAVLADYRGKGIGKRLMEVAIAHLHSQRITAIKINAQLQVQDFYERLGFVPHGSAFEEAGIPHIEMRLPLG